MKVFSCISLLLLCASSVLALNVVTKCTGALKNNCPSNYEKEWQGRTAKDSECFCVRPETEDKAAKRAEEEKPQRCLSALDQCKMYDSNYENLNGRVRGCEQVMEYCDLDEINLLCYDLKVRDAKWSCEKSSAYHTRIRQEEAKKRQKVCGSVKETCISRGQYFATTSMNGKSCEEFVRTCPKNEVVDFCKKHNHKTQQGRWKCELSPAYKARKEVHI